MTAETRPCTVHGEPPHGGDVSGGAAATARYVKESYPRPVGRHLRRSNGAPCTVLKDLTVSLFLTFSRPRETTAKRPNGEPPHGGGPTQHRGGWSVWCGGGWWYHYGIKVVGRAAAGTRVVA